ncbi:MarR family winged helix-turn-helix transcriptional regulator [Flavisphingomonas formosensis]|uniref:MarR family winged helix-turn-helix transcriptional regulator n=1 Tax=Flavisphingomonas formosensis TaxID=861534 RepID=UPI0012F9FA17|nr:MarR family transcriptional regulator [Sphingomonas formosensis]
MAGLADQLRPVMLKLSRHLRREALKVGISDLDAQLLGIIKRKPGLGISELADIEHMSRPTMSAHVKRLEEAGWLMREAEDPDGDRRRVRLVLSPEGKRALEAIRRTRNDWLEARLGQLSAEEFAALDAALGSLVRLVEVRG